MFTNHRVERKQDSVSGYAEITNPGAPFADLSCRQDKLIDHGQLERLRDDNVGHIEILFGYQLGKTKNHGNNRGGLASSQNGQNVQTADVGKIQIQKNQIILR